MSHKFPRRGRAAILISVSAGLIFGAIALGLAPKDLTWASHARAANAATAGEVWRVLSIGGFAESRAADGELAWTPLAVGSLLQPGSMVRTDSGGHVALGNGVEVVNVDPDSIIQLPARKERSVTRVMQWFGEVLYEVGKGPAGHFEVDTPHLVAAVKGTTFTVTVGDDGSVVDVSEGVVEVAAEGQGGARSDVTAGSAASVSASQPDHVSVSPGKSAAAGSAAASKSSAQSNSKSNANGSNGSANGNGNGNSNGNGNGNGNGKGNGNGNGN